jgi:hypothetical protein
LELVSHFPRKLQIIPGYNKFKEKYSKSTAKAKKLLTFLKFESILLDDV